MVGDRAQHRRAAVDRTRVVGKEPAADFAADAIGRHHQIGLQDGGAVTDVNLPRAGRLDRGGLGAEHQRPGGQRLAGEPVQGGPGDAHDRRAHRLLQRRAVHPSHSAAPGRPSASAVLASRCVPNRPAGAEFVQCPHAVGSQGDTRPRVRERGSALEDRHVPADAVRADRGGESAYASSDHHCRVPHTEVPPSTPPRPTSVRAPRCSPDSSPAWSASTRRNSKRRPKRSPPRARLRSW